MPILDYFPKQLKPRKSQEIVIQEIDKVFQTGKRIVILEAPVGSGKSAVAMTFARASGKAALTEPSGGAHILTPRKSLQDQYFNDFPEDLVLMKGRNAYPCIIDAKPRQYVPILEAIRFGKVRQPGVGENNCSSAPCRNDKAVYGLCTQDHPCPYTLAIEVAQQSDIIIHNLHSFIFQTNFGGRFLKRSIIIIDEAHDLEGSIREFITKKIYVNHVVSEQDIVHIKSVKELSDFFLQPKFIPEETEVDRAKKLADSTYVSAREAYLQKIEAFEDNEDSFAKGFSIEASPVFAPGHGSKQVGTSFSVIPHSLGSAVENLLLSYGGKVLLMSGTVYNKETFCRNLGINPNDAHFIRVGSSFPKENRPIYAKSDYQVDTSHKLWDENYQEMVGKTKKIMDIFSDAKGLIHAPSYAVSHLLASSLNSPRVVTHNPGDFLTLLEEFYEAKGNQIFVSPVCQQGVDFKQDRARFQIILRVPYLNTSSKFVEDKVKGDFPWYNYQALVTFGQQIGRINRAEDDFGATFLLDERFNKFLSKNRSVLPGWLNDAIIK